MKVNPASSQHDLIIRIQHHEKNYTCLDNRTLRDGRLSRAARGLLVELLSYPADWRVNARYLASTNEKDGYKAVLAQLSELEECGYLTKSLVRDKQGRFQGWESVVREIPIPQEECVLTTAEVPLEQSVESPEIKGSTEIPLTEVGATEFRQKNLITKTVYTKYGFNKSSPLPSPEKNERERRKGRNKRGSAQETATPDQSTNTFGVSASNFNLDEGSAAAPVETGENLTPLQAMQNWLSNRVFVQWWANRVEKSDYARKGLEMPPVAFVRKRIRNLFKAGDEETIQDMFEAFQVEVDQHVAAHNEAVAAGIVQTDLEQEQIAAIAPYSQVASATPAIAAAAPPPPDSVGRAPDTENPDSYRVRTADELPPEIEEKPDCWQDALKKLCAKRSMNKPSMRDFAREKSPIEHYGSLLRSGVSSLQKEALQWAWNRADVEVVYDDEGSPYDLKLKRSF